MFATQLCLSCFARVQRVTSMAKFMDSKYSTGSLLSPFLQFRVFAEKHPPKPSSEARVFQFFAYPPLPPVSRAVRTERRVARRDLKGPGSQTEKPLQDFRVGKKNVRELGGEYFRRVRNAVVLVLFWWRSPLRSASVS